VRDKKDKKETRRRKQKQRPKAHPGDQMAAYISDTRAKVAS